MISQPVIPRVPLALQASSGVTIDPVSGVVTLSIGALSPADAAAILQASVAALPNADPHVAGVWWNDGGVPAISRG